MAAAGKVDRKGLQEEKNSMVALAANLEDPCELKEETGSCRNAGGS